MKKFGLIFAGFGALFVCIGIAMAAVQHIKIVNSTPVRATILSTDIKTHRSSSSGSRGGSSTTYEPIVRYRYTYNGRDYTGEKVTPISVSSGYNWARSIVNQFQVGSEVEAYINPAKPQKAFLLKKPQFLPYIFILFPMIFVCVGVGIAISGGASTKKPPEPVPSTEGWYEVLPTKPLKSRVRAALLAMSLWDGVGILVCGHYFVLAEPPYGLLALIATGVYFALGLVPIGMAVYYAILGSKVSDAQLFIDKTKVARGEDLTVAVRQVVMKDIRLQEAKIGLVCTAAVKTRSGGKTTYSTEKEYEDSITCLTDQDIRGGNNLEFSGQLTLPAEQLPSSPPGSKNYPMYTWAVSVNLKLAGSPDYRAKFPITVT